MSAARQRSGATAGSTATEDNDHVDSPDLPPFDAVAEELQRLLTSWEKYVAPPGQLTFTPGKGRTLEDVLVAYGLAAHTHRLGRAVLLLLRADLTVEAVPTIRTMFELGLTAQWIMQVPGAAGAFWNKQLASRRKVLEGLPSLQIPTVTAESVQPAIDALDELEKAQTDASHRFDEICNALEPGGVAAYTHYRFLCQMSHASDYLVEQYFDQDPNGPGLSSRASPPAMQANALAGLATAQVVWAGQAVEYADSAHTRRSDLQRAANFIGIERVLKPTGHGSPRKR